MLDRKIGMQLYTLRDSCNTIEDYEKTCQKLQQIGYKMVQISGIAPTDAAKLKEAAAKNGIEVTLTHCPPDKFLNDMDWIASYHKSLDCKIAGIGSMPGIWDIKDNMSDDFIKDFISIFKPVPEELKKHGIKFGYHNHAAEFMKYKGKHIIDIIIEEMGDDNFTLIFDAYWASYAGVNPAKFIREHKNKIDCIHFKDMVIYGAREVRMAPIGDGNLDWDDIIDACDESGVKYAYVEQDDCFGEDPFDCVKKSYDFLSKKGFY